ncbi:MAG: gamma-glutamyl-gamma-aminobutyrate hydrolase family protein, partial [Acidobacteriota bacterium]|nr:gamma-glutamyl-gamma-aminobutyrate hydrolase family protein [Acidobacteriota bacterium]
MSKRVLIPFRHRAKLKPYIEAVYAGGMEPIVTDVECPQKFVDVEGLLLMGGSDVNPQRYYAHAQPETEQADDVRDEVELGFIDQALQKDVPILAICRGLQILNVYHGGTLVQHLPSHPRHDIAAEKRGEPAHSVVIEPQSLLAEVACTAMLSVNSRHHQAADRIGEELWV